MISLTINSDEYQYQLYNQIWLITALGAIAKLFDHRTIIRILLL